MTYHTLIPLSGKAGDGLHALVDAEDEPLVAGFRWHLAKVGYAACGVWRDRRERVLYMHRLILNPSPGLQVDHINRDRLDNRRSNLRLATRRQQEGNKGRRSDNRSGYRGVSQDRGGRWRAGISVDGRSVFLGRWPTPEDAARAYDAAATAHFGEFAYLNFPKVGA